MDKGPICLTKEFRSSVAIKKGMKSQLVAQFAVLSSYIKSNSSIPSFASSHDRIIVTVSH